MDLPAAHVFYRFAESLLGTGFSGSWWSIFHWDLPHIHIHIQTETSLERSRGLWVLGTVLFVCFISTVESITDIPFFPH